MLILKVLSCSWITCYKTSLSITRKKNERERDAAIICNSAEGQRIWDNSLTVEFGGKSLVTPHWLTYKALALWKCIIICIQFSSRYTYIYWFPAVVLFSNFPLKKKKKEAQAGLLFFIPISLKLVGWSDWIGCISYPASWYYLHLKSKNKHFFFHRLWNCNHKCSFQTTPCR